MINGCLSASVVSPHTYATICTMMMSLLTNDNAIGSHSLNTFCICAQSASAAYICTPYEDFCGHDFAIATNPSSLYRSDYHLQPLTNNSDDSTSHDTGAACKINGCDKSVAQCLSGGGGWKVINTSSCHPLQVML